MEISLNGQTEVVQDGISLAQLIQQTIPQTMRIAVEVNQEIIPRSRHAACVLNSGDRVEIVRAIGGG